MSKDKIEAQDTLHDTENQYVTFFIDDQMFGIPVLAIRDVFQSDKVTPIPKSPKTVYGAINLRGHIITAINLRERLGFPYNEEINHECMNISVEFGSEIYSLVVDSVGEVLTLSQDTYEKNPATLDPRWKEVSNGIHKLKGRLLIILDIDQVLNFQDKGREKECLSA